MSYGASSTAAMKYMLQTERVPLVGNPTNRLGVYTKDQVFINVIPESVLNAVTNTKKIWLIKRGGFTVDTTVNGAGAAGRAIYYWPISGKTYSIVGNTLYSNTSSLQTFTTSTGTAWITEHHGTAGSFLVVTDGTNMYRISSADAVVAITDVDLPASHFTPVFFDSYIFIGKTNTSQIYNSAVDDPTNWVPTDFLSAEQYADNLVALTRQINYLVAFGVYSTEFYYDNANASGSPLRRQDAVSLKVGCAARDTVAQIDRRIFWVGQTQTGDPSIWKFDGLTPEEISNEFIRKILKNEGSSLASAKGFVISHRGHILYILNLSSASRTLVYDCDEKMWIDWSSNSASSHVVLPFNYATEGANNKILLLHNTDGKIYTLDPTIHTDDGGAILVKIITDKIDFNSTSYKEQVGLTLVGDVQASGTVTVDWSDDDYASYKTSRSFDLTAGRAYSKAGGVFRRRAYRLQHSANTPFRAESLELDYKLRVV